MSLADAFWWLLYAVAAIGLLAAIHEIALGFRRMGDEP